MHPGGPTKGFKDNLSSWFEMSARHEGDLAITTWIPLRPELCDAHGAARVATLAFAVDSAVGMVAGFSSLPNWVVTTDIDLRLFGEARVGPIRTEAVPVRAGRTQALAEARLYDEGQADLLIGHVTANHGVLTPEGGAPLEVFPVGEMQRQDPPPAEALVPMGQYFGARAVAPGVAELAMVAAARNPWGILHGTLHLLLVEDAVSSLVDGKILDVCIRFLAPVRVGPARATATVLAGAGDTITVRVEVRDPGADDRLGSIATVTVAPT